MRIGNLFLFISLLGILSHPPSSLQRSTQAVSSPSSASNEIWRTYAAAQTVLTLATQGDNLWIGAESGITRVDTAKGSFTKFTSAGSLPNYKITAIGFDAAANVWIGSDGGGVSRFDGVSWKIYTQNDGLANDTVNVLLGDDEGKIWFGTSDGLSKYDGTTWTTYATDDGLSSNVILAIAQDAAGNLWFGTENGVFTFTLSTANASQGFYLVKVSERPSAQARLWLDAQQPIRPREDDYTLIDIPAGIAVTPRFYLPILNRMRKLSSG